MSRDIMFCQIMLRTLRFEAKAKGVKLPKHMTALKSGVGNWYLVEASGGFRQEVCAANAYDARCKAIEKLIPQ
jgi:hypothetical protein